MLGEFSKDFFVCYNILQANGGNKDGGQMIKPVGNRMHLSGLEQREVGRFRNVAWSYIPSMLARGSSIVRHEEMD